MSFFSFLWLIYQIFINKKPDLDSIRKKWLLATKIGQLYALRADFIGVERATILTQLYEKNFENNRTATPFVFEESFKNQFDSIEASPFSEASIGKVYGAKLWWRDFVIKVIKSDFRHKFITDVTRLKKYFKFMIFFYPKLARVADPVGTLEDLERMTLSELDLRNEIRGVEMLHKTLDKNAEFISNTVSHHLSFPEFMPELSSEKILVSERLTGKSFRELLENHTLPYPVLIDFFFQHVFCMLYDGYFHEDIHSGNIFFQDDKIYLLDNGSIWFASPNLRHGLTRFFDDLTHDRIPEAASSLILMAQNREENKNNFLAYEKNFISLYADFSKKTLREISLTQQMMASIKMAVHAGYTFERWMYPIIKSFMYLDGMARTCNPETKLMEDVRPLIEKFVEYTKANPA